MNFVDLENVEDDGENCVSGFVLLVELMKINFWLLIGYMDEVWSLKYSNSID